MTRSNGANTSYGYDGASRLTSLAHDLPGTGQDQTYGFTYNPVGQIHQRTSSNDVFAYDGYTNGAAAYTNNGLNQVTAAAGAAVTWDTSGNLANDGTRAYSYDAANRLTQAGSSGMTYDAFDRMSQLSTVRFGWVGTEVVSEHDTANVLTRRNVPGPWQDEVAVYYLDDTTTGRRWPLTDQQGSVVSYSRPDGTLGSVNAYDEYGIGAAGNTGRFGYTGQMTFAGIGLSYYKARFYAPELGRFLQTDPSGYAAGANLYGYVGGDPVNWVDPMGLYQDCSSEPECVPSSLPEVIVWGSRDDLGEVMILFPPYEFTVIPYSQDYTNGFGPYFEPTPEPIADEQVITECYFYTQFKFAQGLGGGGSAAAGMGVLSNLPKPRFLGAGGLGLQVLGEAGLTIFGDTSIFTTLPLAAAGAFLPASHDAALGIAALVLPPTSEGRNPCET